MISPAKINLGLKILFKRQDGYHELNSIFIKIHWGDEIYFEEIEKGKFELISENLLNGEKRKLYDEVSEKGDIKKNILYKAFLESVKLSPEIGGVRVRIKKKIPPGGGLGGGSSNAGMLFYHFFKNTSPENFNKLIQITSKVGADIPFFIKGKNSIVTGIGENLSDIVISSGLGILAIPDISINTKEAFAYLKKPLQAEVNLKEWNFLQEKDLLSLRNGDWKYLSGRFENDFEEFAFRNYSILKEIKSKFLEYGASFASLTGTGSCIYGLVSDEKLREEIFEKMKDHFSDCKFINFSF
ncbi:MAG: 4-(cytidine 5'-diphospho)-2-C-methyl-D-erythritol kinase [Leptospiraceae bacterium]|nr:4-(cytidine 5'-diphospho)-2-C-methyl-D-erythritol kinase [Leptospiraceae bacterium]MCK6379982.1 4-(cytidine 5'-diphospho)-2-C-methyl-D-erythritol kinase [Leptospiraceae bacterium]